MESACFSRLWNDRPPLTMSAEGTCVVLSNRVTYHIIIMTRRRILYISRGQPAVTFQRNPIIARRRVTQFTPKRRAIWRILYLLSLVLVVLGQGRYICSYTAWIETNAIVLQSMGVGYAVHHVRPISKAISRWLFFFFSMLPLFLPWVVPRIGDWRSFAGSSRILELQMTILFTAIASLAANPLRGWGCLATTPSTRYIVRDQWIEFGLIFLLGLRLLTSYSHPIAQAVCNINGTCTRKYFRVAVLIFR